LRKDASKKKRAKVARENAQQEESKKLLQELMQQQRFSRAYRSIPENASNVRKSGVFRMDRRTSIPAAYMGSKIRQMQNQFQKQDLLKRMELTSAGRQLYPQNIGSGLNARPRKLFILIV